MRYLDSRRALSFSLFIVLTVSFLASGSSAQMTTPVSGTITATYTQQDSIVVSPAEMHLMVLGLSGGTNASTGTNPFMEGATATNMSFSDLVKGNGPHQGYVKFEKEGNSAIAKWSGKVTTTMPQEGAPMIRFEGTFTYVGGTGKYQGIKGEGTYKGMFTAKDTYTVEWQGTYTAGM